MAAPSSAVPKAGPPLRIPGAMGDGALHAFSLIILLVGVGLLFFIVYFLGQQAFHADGALPGVTAFLLTDRWVPLAEPPRLGILHAWVSTLYITGISLAIAVPVGVLIAIFASDYAPPQVAAVLQPCLEVLAGIPSVVYGFFGFVTLVVWFEAWFDMATGVSVLAAGLIVAVMIMPFIASTATEALRAVPADIREAGMNAGVTKFYVIRRLVLPRALPGIFAGVVLAFARGVGETLAALMLAGNSLAVPVGLLDRGQSLTALITTDLGEAAVGTPKYHALFAAAMVLLVIILGINIGIRLLRQRMLRHG